MNVKTPKWGTDGREKCNLLEKPLIVCPHRQFQRTLPLSLLRIITPSICPSAGSHRASLLPRCHPHGEMGRGVLGREWEDLRSLLTHILKKRQERQSSLRPAKTLL